jgi:hypothetical protein
MEIQPNRTIKRTRWQALLQLLRLFWVVQGQSVEISRASNLELGLQLAARCF